MKEKHIMKKIVSFLLVFCMVTGIAFSNVGSREVQAEASVAEAGVTMLKPLTFADFGITDGTYEGGFFAYALNTVDSSKVTSLTLADSVVSGYIQLNTDGREVTNNALLILGGTGWAGVQIAFNTNTNQMSVNTTSITSTNGEGFVYQCEDGLFESKFKLAISFECVAADEDNNQNDLLLKVHINDELKVAIETGAYILYPDLSLSGTSGEYYIRDYSSTNFMPYINTKQINSTDTTMYKSITLESCELPYTSTTTFTNYGLDNQDFSGSVIGGEVTNSMEYTKFVGDVTLGGAGTAMINYGATTANNSNIGGLQLQITADTGAFWIITGTRLGGKYINEPDKSGDNIQYYSSGLPVGEAFRLSFNSIPWDWDCDGVATDGKIEIRVDGKLLKDQYIFIENMFSDTDEVTLVNRIGVLAGGNFASTSTVNIASVTTTTDDEEEGGDTTETVVDKRILTFADFGITDATYEGGFGTGTLKTVDSTKVPSLTLADSEINGYIQLDGAGRSVSNLAYWIVGHTGWAGMQVTFNPYDATCDRISIVTSSLTSTNAEAFLYVLKDGLFEKGFKITLSFTTVDSDGDKEKDDLALRLYVNDELCTAAMSSIANATLSTGETVGEYYICDYKADAFRPYMRTQQISSTNETMYKSVTVKSCELPYKNTTTFVDYGIADQTFDGSYITGKFPGTLEYTKLSGNVTLSGTGTCMINYGGTTTSEADTTYPNMQLGGMRLQIVADTGKIWIIPGTRLGGIYLNEATESTVGYANALPVGQSFELSLNTIPWDWDGDGVATDGKIEIRIDGKLLKDKYVIIDEMFSDTVSLVNRFSLLAKGHFGGSAAITVASKPAEVSRLRKLELADFGLANGEYVAQVHKSKGPDTLVNTMMEVNMSIEESTSGSWFHYAVPLGNAWQGISFRVLGDTITVVKVSDSTTLGTIKASEIKRSSFYGEAFKFGLSIERIDFQGDGENDDARLGVWMEGKLLRNYYYVDSIDELGTGISILPYLTAEETYQNTVTISDVTETNSVFETKLGLDDVNASGVAPGVYGYSENPETKTLNPANQGAKDGDLDNAIFSTNVRFSKEHAKLFYGCPTDSGKGWYGIWIGPDGNAGETFTANYAGSYSLLDIDDKVIPDPTMHAGVAGVQLVNNTYKLGISTRYVDSDGDDLFDDLEVGIWFNDVLYNNTYCYINGERLVSELKPNIAVHAANSDGYVVLGNYTQETATPVTHCADEFAYFVDGAEVTVAGESKGTSWTVDVSGEYAVTYTNTTDMGTSTFKENVLVYKTNDVTADGKVSAVDLVALKRLAKELRNDITTAAGKMAVGYAEGSNWYTTEVLNAMYEKLLADENTIGAKVMSEEILGETGSQTPGGNSTYITSLGATKEGTSVIGISDVADAANRTYATDIDAFDGSGLDFVLDFDTDREIKVLQITDTQIIDAGQCRTENRLSANEKTMWATDQIDVQLFDELRALVAKEKPDLIVMTGDNVYGEFDDTGAALTKLITVMDEFKIPWAPIFGNHDNETKLGVSWQCQQFMESDYCIFNRRNEIGGNGNYSIGISVQGNIQRTIFMMDTNGCNNLSGVENQEDKDAVTINFVFHNEQMAWYRTTAEKVNQHMDAKIPSFLCVHVPLAEVTTALVETGYQTKADSNLNGISISHNYTVGNIVADGTAWKYEKDANENFGFKEARTIAASAMSEFILPHMKAAGTDGTFFGHQHNNALSVEWEGIRFTYGLKTGFYDEDPNQTGGTVITLNGSAFDVNHTIINNLETE